MRKIDKTIRRSLAYRDWERGLETSGNPHPAYTSSNGRFYNDIVMELLACQGGLCAYTEQRLCSPAVVDDSCWQDGRYAKEMPEMEHNLDHFDPGYKTDTTAGRCTAWLWNNFFVIKDSVNQKVKRDKTVDELLKPDHPDFKPKQVLAYSVSANRWTPHPALSEGTKERVRQMIAVLGLNFGPVVDHRTDRLKEWKREIRWEIRTWDDEPPEYPSAFEALRQEQQNT